MSGLPHSRRRRCSGSWRRPRGNWRRGQPQHSRSALGRAPLLRRGCLCRPRLAGLKAELPHGPATPLRRTTACTLECYRRGQPRRAAAASRSRFDYSRRTLGQMSAAAAAAGVKISAVTRRPVGKATALSGGAVVVPPGGVRWGAGGGGNLEPSSPPGKRPGGSPRLAWTPSPAWFVLTTSGGARQRHRLDAAPRPPPASCPLTTARFCPLCSSATMVAVNCRPAPPGPHPCPHLGRLCETTRGDARRSLAGRQQIRRPTRTSAR